MDLGREVLESRCDVDARLKRGTEQREEHLFPDGEGGNVCWSDGGETCRGSPRSAAVLWKIETRWSRFPLVWMGERGAGAVFLGGHPEGRRCLEVRVGTRGPTVRTKSMGEEMVGRTT